MINNTLIAEELLKSTAEEGLKIMGEIFLPSMLIGILVTLVLMLLLGLITLRRGWGKFFIIFIIPLLIFILIIIFTFIIPVLPRISGEWMQGILRK